MASPQRLNNTRTTEDLATRCADTFQKAMGNHKRMIQSYKRYYDRKVYNPVIAIGSTVYSKTNKIKVGHSRALSKTYFGSLRVVGVSDIAIKSVPVSKPDCDAIWIAKKRCKLVKACHQPS